MVYLGLSSLLNIEENVYLHIAKPTRVIRHPDFNDETGYINDIAIVILEQPVEYSFGVSPVCLPDKTIPETFVNNSTLVILGFGRVGEGLESSNDLLKAEVSEYSNEECINFFKVKGIKKGITNRNICAISGKNDCKDTCAGDSGGPVIYKSNRDYLIGVVSSGLQCGFKYPSINTKVRSYIEWIAQKAFEN